ncbi:hypothetical protein Dsin_012818 [Dipteronia sinensis]|uniref:RNase H type-1 domain-containing protein n=1 Tax=Dipteronia sinensis TaxID=43782 RepID=A0AAE0AIS8_9ROSI|nr:hypothetical protein Dsin_012818 [Dipteronia sinensis]
MDLGGLDQKIILCGEGLFVLDMVVSTFELMWDWKGSSVTSPFVKAIVSLFADVSNTSRVLKEGLKLSLVMDGILCFCAWCGQFVRLETRWFSTASRQAIDYVTDTLKFRVAWWFKHHGKGSKLPISMMLSDIKVSCLEPKFVKPVNPSVWLPPTGDALKVNVDGSARGNPGSAGIGGVMRDNSGKVLIGKKIDIVSDSKVAVSWVNSEGIGILKHVETIFNIRNMLCILGNTQVIFNSRDSNYFVDTPAKKGST